MQTKVDIQKFCAELTALCKQHGVYLEGDMDDIIVVPVGSHGQSDLYEMWWGDSTNEFDWTQVQEDE